MTQSAPRSRRRRIVVMSRLMAMASVAVAFALPMIVAAHWLLASPATLLRGTGLSASLPLTLEAGDRLLGAAASFIAIIPISWAFVRLQSCFDGFARGDLFGPRTIQGFREFGLGLLASAILTLPATAASSVVLSGGREMAVSFGSDTILMVCVSGTVAVVGWVLGEAALLAEENEAFV